MKKRFKKEEPQIKKNSFLTGGFLVKNYDYANHNIFPGQ